MCKRRLIHMNIQSSRLQNILSKSKFLNMKANQLYLLLLIFNLSASSEALLLYYGHYRVSTTQQFDFFFFFFLFSLKLEN